MAYNLTEIQTLLRQSGWPENLIAKYAAVVMYESGGSVYAHNTDGENSYGLLQIYLRYHPDFDTSRYTDPIYNLSYAYGIYQREGDHAWLTSVGKYNRNYQGVAAQSRAIYNGNGVTNTVINDPSIITDPNQLQVLVDNGGDGSDISNQDLFFYVGAGLLALFILRD